MKFSELKKGDLLIKPDAIFPYNEMQEVISVEKNEERNSSWSPCFILTAVGITTKHTYKFCLNNIEDEIEPFFVRVKDNKERTEIISNNRLTELTRGFINFIQENVNNNAYKLFGYDDVGGQNDFKEKAKVIIEEIMKGENSVV